jgi:hypothetical protein
MEHKMQASDFSRIEGVVVKTENRAEGSSSISLFGGSSAFTITKNVNGLVVWIELEDGQEQPIILPDNGFLCREGNQIALGLFKGIPIVGINYTTKIKRLLTPIERSLPDGRNRNITFDATEMAIAIGGVSIFVTVLAVLWMIKAIGLLSLNTDSVMMLVLGSFVLSFAGVLGAVIRERLRSHNKQSAITAKNEQEIRKYVNDFQ